MDNTNLFFFFLKRLHLLQEVQYSIVHSNKLVSLCCFSLTVILSPCPATHGLGAAPQTGTSQVRVGAGASFPDCDGLPSIFDVLRLADPSSNLLPSQGILLVSSLCAYLLMCVCCCCSVCKLCWLFVTPWTTACQAPLSSIISWSSLTFMPTESVMLSNHVIFCCFLLLPSIFPSFRVFFNELTLHIRWPKYRSFSISPSNEYSGLISFRTDWLDLLAVQRLSRVFSSTIQNHQFFSTQPSLWSNSYTHT